MYYLSCTKCLFSSCTHLGKCQLSNIQISFGMEGNPLSLLFFRPTLTLCFELFHPAELSFTSILRFFGIRNNNNNVHYFFLWARSTCQHGNYCAQTPYYAVNLSLTPSFQFHATWSLPHSHNTDMWIFCKGCSELGHFPVNGIWFLSGL